MVPALSRSQKKWNAFVLDQWLKHPDGPHFGDPNIPKTGGITQTADDFNSSTYLFASYGEAIQGDADLFSVSALQAVQVKAIHRGTGWGDGWNTNIYTPVTTAMTSDAFANLNCLHPELDPIQRVELP